MRKLFKKAVAMATVGVLTMAAMVGVTSDRAQAYTELNKEGKAAMKAAKDGTVNLEEGSEYHAYLLFQACESWVGRGRFYEKGQGVDCDFWDKLYTTLNSDDFIPLEGTKVEDATIKGNGHYTIKVTGIDGRCTAEVAGSTEAYLGILGFTTDIPHDKGITFDNVSVKIDDISKGKKSGAEIYYDRDDIVDPGLTTVELVNTWHDECKNPLGLMLPQDSIEISFDVSGFNYDNPDAVEATPTPAPKKADSGSGDKKGESSFPVVPVAVGIAAVVVIAGVVIVIRKKK